MLVCISSSCEPDEPDWLESEFIDFGVAIRIYVHVSICCCVLPKPAEKKWREEQSCCCCRCRPGTYLKRRRRRVGAGRSRLEEKHCLLESNGFDLDGTNDRVLSLWPRFWFWSETKTTDGWSGRDRRQTMRERSVPGESEERRRASKGNTGS